MFRSFKNVLARPDQRGYWCGTYNTKDSPKQCPGCGRHHWIIGRLSRTETTTGTTLLCPGAREVTRISRWIGHAVDLFTRKAAATFTSSISRLA